MSTATRLSETTPARADAPEPSRELALDGLRGLTALVVVLNHTWPSAAPGGYLGVDVFFVLSGFLITRLLVAEFQRADRIRLRRFAARRALRLCPAYFAMLAVVLLWTATEYPAAMRHAIFAASPFAFTYTLNLYRAAGHEPSMIGHAWSLAIEEQYYLVWPLVLAVLLRGGRRRALRACVVGVVAAAALVAVESARGASSDYLYNAPESSVPSLLIGSGLAIAASLGWLQQIGSRTVSLAGLVGGAVLAGVITFGFPYWWLFPYGSLLLGLATAAVIGALSVHRTTRVARMLSARLLVRLGLLSYGLYLWHIPIRDAILVRGGRPGPELFVVCLGFGLLLSWASLVVIERPVTAYRDRRFRHTAAPG